jgi:hypothetical protein
MAFICSANWSCASFFLSALLFLQYAQVDLCRLGCREKRSSDLTQIDNQGTGDKHICARHGLLNVKLHKGRRAWTRFRGDKDNSVGFVID